MLPIILDKNGLGQGCQIVYFQTKNRNLGKLWRALELKMFVYFMTIWNILQQFGKIYAHFCIVCGHMVYFSQIGMFGPRKIWHLRAGLHFGRFICKLI
jgi:hypothetical protein